MRTLVLLALVLVASPSMGADLQQIQFRHEGSCDGTYHNVRFYDNVTGAPIRVVQGMLLNGGSGAQGAYIARRSDGFFFTPLGAALPPYYTAIHALRGDLVLGPGDGLNFIHWCDPPERYDFWVIVDYSR